MQRGELVIDRRRGTRGDAWVPVAKLVLPGMDTWSLPALEEVRVLRWRGIDIVLTGIEHIGRPKQSRAQVQSWWVRLVID